MKKSILFLIRLITKASLILTVCSCYVNAQPAVQSQIDKLMPKPVPQAPNVAALGKYGDYEVDLFNGVPEISIPIFEVKSGSLSLPITLNYHASGVRPTDIASWVGMGWSLSAGGQVARNIQGKPDEAHYSGNVLKANPAVCGPAGTGTFYYLLNAAIGVTDTEPDIFSYSFPGKSGKFILPYGNAPILFPYSPVVLNAPSGFPKFEITDERGVLHRFGQNGVGTVTSADLTTSTNGGNPSFSAITAWHLMEMIAPNSDDKISLTYQPLGSSTTHDISYVYTVMDQCYASNFEPEASPCPPSFNGIPQLKNLDSYSAQKDLQTITFETGKVQFLLGGARNDVSTLNRLSQVKIYSLVNGGYVLQKIVEFNYSYFTNASGGDQALKLDGIQFKDKNDQVIQQYSFTYFTNSFSWTPTAPNFLNARDLWGYYNGAMLNTDLVLPTTIPYNETTGSATVNKTFGGGLNRSVNTQFIKEGVLKRITFPTGGYTEFDFEQNKYQKDGVSTDVGGLRVTKITSSDGTSAPPVVKTYKYGSGESGYGIPNFLDTKFNYSSTQKYYSDCPITSPISSYQIRTYFSNSSFSQESNIMYPVVTEYVGDLSGTTNGKTVYVYDNGSPTLDPPTVIPGSSKNYTNSLAWRRGKLTSKTIYDNTNQKLRAVSINYSLFKSANNLVGLGVYQYIAGNYSTCSGFTCANEAGELVNPQTFFFGTIYQNSGAWLESSVTESDYQGSDNTKFIDKTNVMTIHPDKLVVTQTVRGLSTNQQSVTVNRYPFDFPADFGSTGVAKGIYNLNQKNILTTPLETYTYLQTTSGTNQQITSAQITTFRENGNNTSQIVPDQIYVWESATAIAIASYVPSAINGANSGITMDPKFALRINMVSYDDAGNIQTVARNNNVNVTYLYGYNKTLPVAEVMNATTTESFYDGFETAVAAGTSHTGIGHTSGAYAPAFTIPNGRTYVIEYWSRPSGGAWSPVATNFSNGMTLPSGFDYDDVRVYPKDAQMKTYTYDPLLGMTSSISESGQTYLYEYDTFGRLAVIRNEKGSIEKQYSYHYKGQSTQ